MGDLPLWREEAASEPNIFPFATYLAFQASEQQAEEVALPACCGARGARRPARCKQPTSHRNPRRSPVGTSAKGLRGGALQALRQQTGRMALQLEKSGMDSVGSEDDRFGTEDASF